MYRNNFFYFLKFIFDISLSKEFKNTKKINLKKTNSKFYKNVLQLQK